MNKGDTQARADLAVSAAHYVIDTKSTIRGAAKQFKISKTCMHLLLTQVLPYTDADLYVQVRKILDKNLSDRHIRGGLATSKKFKKGI